ncbi:MAG: hypothetical protein R3321_02390 [Nitrososphaeraceae archaeon]|nr:hypothetical protein [Nitrososphaeraceae archaeon]
MIKIKKTKNRVNISMHKGAFEIMFDALSNFHMSMNRFDKIETQKMAVLEIICLEMFTFMRENDGI